MKLGIRIGWLFAFLFASPMGITENSVWAQAGQAEKDYTLQYYADVAIFSIVPAKGLTSIERFAGGSSVGGSGTLGLGELYDKRRFKVTLRSHATSESFSIDVTLEPEDGITKKLKTTVDLTSLTPQSIELARDDDGRVYQLNLLPRVNQNPRPKPFRESDMQLDRFSFRSSEIFLNDQDYLGQMNMFSGNVGIVDIPGLAKVEFSLLQLKVAKPEGTLRDGVITIKHSDGTTLRINHVQNGKDGTALPGGPYQVWVRWLRPSQSHAEYKKTLAKQLETYRIGIASGELDIAPETIARIETAAASDRVLLISSGMRSALSGEIQPEQE